MSTEPLFETCEAVGHCPRPTVEAAPFHELHFDSDRDEQGIKIIRAVRVDENYVSIWYGAMICKSCGLKALVRMDKKYSLRVLPIILILIALISFSVWLGTRNMEGKKKELPKHLIPSLWERSQMPLME